LEEKERNAKINDIRGENQEQSWFRKREARGSAKIFYYCLSLSITEKEVHQLRRGTERESKPEIAGLPLRKKVTGSASWKI